MRLWIVNQVGLLFTTSLLCREVGNSIMAAVLNPLIRYKARMLAYQ